MPSVTLNAYFNGQQIVLDEAFDLPENAKLLVTILEIPDVTRDVIDLAIDSDTAIPAMFASETVLKRDWDSAEENVAWANL